MPKDAAEGSEQATKPAASTNGAPASNDPLDQAQAKAGKAAPEGPKAGGASKPNGAKAKRGGKPKRDASAPRTGWFHWFLGRDMSDAGPVTPVPPIEPPLTEVKTQEFVPGTSYSRVIFDGDRSRHMYQVLEPRLTDAEQRALVFIREVLIRTLDAELEVIGRAASPESVEYLQDKVTQVARQYRIRLSRTSMKRLGYFLQRDFTGYGPIDVMMHDPDIEDISCDGFRTPIFLYHRKHGSMESDVRFSSAEELDGFVIRMAQRSGKQITIADPLLDSSLPDGSRLQATLGREVTDNGSTFTIRRFREHPFSPIDLVRMGTVSTELLAYCWIVVQYGANMMLAGGTASGKTTTLNTLALFIPPQAKIVSIEDTREINLPHQNWVRSMTRGGTRATDVKRVDMFDLLTAALRQRPEFIIVGEVRGKEATVAFQAMATGHTVLGTIHADSPRSVVYRLESEPINIPRIVIQSLDVIVLQAMISFKGRRQRRVQIVSEIVGIDPGSKELLTHDVFTRNPNTDLLHFTGRSYKLERIAQRNSWSGPDLEKEFRRRTRIIQMLLDGPALSFEQIADTLSAYEHRPDTTEAELEKLLASVAAAASGAKQ